jgi:hypothetical protein
MLTSNPYHSSRIDAKRRNDISAKRKQFAEPTFAKQEYPHRLNFYTVPPTQEITLEQFEGWAIDRLRGKSCIRAKRGLGVWGPCPMRGNKQRMEVGMEC